MKLEEKNAKKCLAVIWSPKNLCDFIWYYVVNGKKDKWDCIVTPFGTGKGDSWEWDDNLIELVQNSGIFEKIYVQKDTFVDKKIIKKLYILVQMFIYALKNKQSEFARKFILKDYKIEQYKRIVMIYISTLFSGALVNQADVSEIVLLEDGIREETTRKTKFDVSLMKTHGLQIALAGFFLSKMGYADPTGEYFFYPIKNCIKYSYNPDIVKPGMYREIYKLNDWEAMSSKDYLEYMSLCDVFFKNMDDSKLEQNIIILFTSPIIYDFGINEKLLNDVLEYITKHHNNEYIFIKRHPRDRCNYKRYTKIKIVELDSNIPAELIMRKMNIDTAYFIWPSAMMLEIGGNINCKLLYSNENCKGEYCRKNISKYLEKMEINEKIVVDI